MSASHPCTRTTESIPASTMDSSAVKLPPMGSTETSAETSMDLFNLLESYPRNAIALRVPGSRVLGSRVPRSEDLDRHLTGRTAGERHLTYGELLDASQQLAEQLLSTGVNMEMVDEDEDDLTNSCCAVLMDRDLEFFITCLAHIRMKRIGLLPLSRDLRNDAERIRNKMVLDGGGRGRDFFLVKMVQTVGRTRLLLGIIGSR